MTFPGAIRPSQQSECLGGNVSRSFVCVSAVILAAGIALHVFLLRQRGESEAMFRNEMALAQADALRIRANLVVPTTERLPTGEDCSTGTEYSRDAS